jgi:alpha-L-fucosidase
MDTIYKPSWNSIKTHQTPQWFKDAKFGIYTCWGVYSVPGCGPNGTWYPYNMYREGTEQYAYHLKTYGGPEKFGYKDFIPMFTAEKFDADEWAELYKSSGAIYAGTVGEHHDGFCMWDTKYSDWSAAKMGPKRDVVGELEKAIRKQGMRFMISLHHAENWWFYPHWMKEYDTSDPRYAGLYGEPHNLDGMKKNYDKSSPRYAGLWGEDHNVEGVVIPNFSDQDRPSKRFMETWKAKTVEVIENYQPDMLVFDYGLQAVPEQYKQDCLAYYFNKEKDWGREVVVTYKNFDFAPGSGVVDWEMGHMNSLTYNEWLTDTSVDIGNGWSFLKETPPYKSTKTLVHYLADNVSKNGYLLLNVGPKPDGTIPEQAKELLKGIGQWMQVNSEAIYGTTCWIAYGEGPNQIEKSWHGNEKDLAEFTAKDVRFTVKDNVLYAICLGWPGEQVKIETLKRLYPAEIRSVKMLGCDQELTWSLSPTEMTIQTPPEKPCEHAYVFKITRGQPYLDPV